MEKGVTSDLILSQRRADTGDGIHDLALLQVKLDIIDGGLQTPDWGMAMRRRSAQTLPGANWRENC
jgi:hypothetical protein